VTQTLDSNACDDFPTGVDLFTYLLTHSVTPGHAHITLFTFA